MTSLSLRRMDICHCTCHQFWQSSLEDIQEFCHARTASIHMKSFLLCFLLLAFAELICSKLHVSSQYFSQYFIKKQHILWSYRYEIENLPSFQWHSLECVSYDVKCHDWSSVMCPYAIKWRWLVHLQLLCHSSCLNYFYQLSVRSTYNLSVEAWISVLELQFSDVELQKCL